MYQAKHKYQGQNIVFIVACPRSGTTWLQRMLAASSPKIKTGPETFLFLNYIEPQISAWDESKKKHRPNLHHSMTRKEFINKVRNHTISLLEPALKELGRGGLYLEKTSSHALVLPAIKEIFPESKIINMIRDPRDVVASWLAASRTWAKEDKPKTAREFATHWKESILATDGFKKTAPSGTFFELRYEDLLNDTLSNLKNVLKFLGINGADSKLKKIISDHHINKMKSSYGYERIIIKGEIGGKKGQIWREPKGYFRKGKIGSWKKDLTLREKYHVKKITGKFMKKFGYT